MDDIQTIVTIVGGALTIVSILLPAGRRMWLWVWRFIRRRRPRIPRQTMKIVQDPRASHWSFGTQDGRDVIHLNFCGYITCVFQGNAMICQVAVSKRKILGFSVIRHPIIKQWGSDSIPPGTTAEVNAHFSVVGLETQLGDTLILPVQFMDQFGNRHLVRKAEFHSKPAKVADQQQSPKELPSEISDPIEKQIAAALIAELDRYRGCGRRVGGLGSVKTEYRGGTMVGVGNHGGSAGGEGFRYLIHDPANARIKSDNADALLKYYDSLDSLGKERFEIGLSERLDYRYGYSDIAYFVLYVFYRVGKLAEVLSRASSGLKGAEPHGYSDFLQLLSGLLRYEYPCFDDSMLDLIEQSIKDEQEYTFRIAEHVAEARSYLLRTRIAKDNDGMI